MAKIYSFCKSRLLNKRKALSVMFTIIFFLLAHTVFARKIHNRQYRFKITIPGTMTLVKPINDTIQGETYYDSIAGIVLIISWRQSKFHKVDEYINCSWKELESILKDCMADTSLRIISCNTEKKITILNFTENLSTDGYQNSIIYFIHHRGKDIQFSFLCRNVFTSDEQKYIRSIMHTLKLK